MNNRLLLGAAVVMSNATGLKKNRLLSFCHGNLLVHQRPDTMQESSNLCLLCIVPVRGKKLTIDWNCCTWLKTPTSKYLVIAKCDKFGTLSQLCCLLLFLRPCLTPVEKAPVIKNHFSSSGIKMWLGLIFCWLAMFHDIIFPSHSEGCSAF